MAQLDPEKQRRFAVDVVRRLRGQSFEALLAGGCVRDQLMGQVPKDYDVATSATPDEIRQLFGHKRTLSIGAAFGVVVVLGGKLAGQVEVVTFRRDLGYSDGRHPDAVAFGTSEEDAARRDFTINGLFYDPLEDHLIDYVGGRDDLDRRLIRAIGDPRERFAEDKLRMLRAVRFAATFDFRIDETTAQAVRELADQVTVVSAERIAQEMRLLLTHANRAEGVRLLHETDLVTPLLPEVALLVGLRLEGRAGAADLWQHTLSVLGLLRDPSFPLALAALLHETGRAAVQESVDAATGDQGPAPWEAASQQIAHAVGRRWRLSSKEAERAKWLVGHQSSFTGAAKQPWPRLQRLLIVEAAHELFALFEARLDAKSADRADVEYCRQKLSLPPGQLNPPPLVDGHDLIAHGVPESKQIRILLERLRDAQLEGQIASKRQALELSDRLRAEGINEKNGTTSKPENA